MATRRKALGLAVGLGLALAAAEPAPAQQLRPVARPATLAPATAPAPVSPAAAEAEAEEPAEPGVGAASGLPLPRFVSLKGAEGNARRGPAMGQRIDWVFLRRGMPLRVTAEHDNWRRVEDHEGEGGWIHYALLSGTRTALVLGEGTSLRARPDAGATEVARLEPGVVADLLACEPAWCRLGAGGHRGWAEKGALWGVEADEVLD